LRKDLIAITPAPIVIEGETVSIAPETVHVDVLRFEALARSDATADLKAAALLYGGDLLAGCTLDEPRFEEWLDPERARLREIAIDVLTRLVPRLDGAEAIETARRLVALDPMRGASQRLLIMLLADRGESDLAMKQHHGYAAGLERELGLQPPASALSLLREISSGQYKKSEPALPVVDGAGLVPPRNDKPLIAVLPFESRSPDPAHRQFCSMLTGDIADAISRVSHLLVVAHAVTAGYLDAANDTRRIGTALGADYVLQGSVQRLADRMRISIHLSSATTGLQVWADQYDGIADQILGAQDMIIKAIAASVETHIMLVGNEVAAETAPGAFTYQDLIGRGFGLLYDERTETLAEALALGERAVAMEPREPLAHELRGYAFILQISARTIPFDPGVVAQGIDLARALVAMVPENEWAYLLLARAHIEAGQVELAVAECERALEINPSGAVAMARLGECYALLGRSEEAIAACRTSLQLDSRTPERYQRHFTMAVAHFTAGNHAEALREAGQVLRWRPDYTRTSLLLAASAAAMGLMSEAGTAVARCLAHYPDLRADQVAPRVMPPFCRPADRERFVALLRTAGLPG
jgi:TolB-like protein/cytochrome c-type biogenesis protein CcmH/NrfG